MKIGKHNKESLVIYLKNNGYKQVHENTWRKRIGRVDYSYTIKKNTYIYFEQEEPIKEGWWRTEFKFKQNESTL